MIDAREIPWSGPRTIEGLVSYSLRELLARQFPPRRILLQRDDTPIVRSGQLIQVFAERGVGKTWLLQTLSLIMAAGGAALGFQTLDPCYVLHVDGEMFGEDLRDRFHRLAKQLNIPADILLTIIAADWQDGALCRLDTQVGQDALEPFVEHANVIVLDNRSCLFDPEGEKDPTAWAPTQDWLLSLRRRGKTVVLGHHSNRQVGARGHSKAEDLLDVLIKLARPDDYSADQGARFVLSFEKMRGVHGSAVAPFTAVLESDGWRIQSDQANTLGARLAEYVRLTERAGEPVKSASSAIKAVGCNKAAGLKVWAEMLRDGSIQKRPEGGFRA